jgi:hypothetical protein
MRRSFFWTNLTSILIALLPRQPEPNKCNAILANQSCPNGSRQQNVLPREHSQSQTRPLALITDLIDDDVNLTCWHVPRIAPDRPIPTAKRQESFLSGTLCEFEGDSDISRLRIFTAD